MNLHPIGYAPYDTAAKTFDLQSTRQTVQAVREVLQIRCDFRQPRISLTEFMKRAHIEVRPVYGDFS